MKLAALALTLIPGIAIASSWSSPGFPRFSAQETGRFTSQSALTNHADAKTRIRFCTPVRRRYCDGRLGGPPLIVTLLVPSRTGSHFKTKN